MIEDVNFHLFETEAHEPFKVTFLNQSYNFSYLELKVLSDDFN